MKDQINLFLFWYFGTIASGQPLVDDPTFFGPERHTDPVIQAENTFLKSFCFKSTAALEQTEGLEIWKRHSNLTGDEAADFGRKLWVIFRQAMKENDRVVVQNAENRITLGGDQIDYTLSKFGMPRKFGWPLTISLHGGGDVPEHENDEQWRIQQVRHTPNGLLLCPRMPKDTWDAWQTDESLAMIDELIRRMLVFHKVDPNSVYLTGFSAGGYAGFVYGAKLADRFAAISSSGGAPSPRMNPAPNFRNTPFLFQIGENDTQYGRLKLCRDFRKQLELLKRQDTGGFTFGYREHAGKKHNIDDTDAIAWMHKHRRNPHPDRIQWELSDSRQKERFWLGIDRPKSGQKVSASIAGNIIRVETENVHRLKIRLNDTLIDLDQPVHIQANGKTLFSGMLTRNLYTMVQTLRERGDYNFIFPVETVVEIPDDLTATP
ncbi:MAG: hypothetical protein AAF514_05265 [Verrucomicrobiota bacterium]